MKTVIQGEFNPSIVVEELIDVVGAIMLKEVFARRSNRKNLPIT